MVRAWVGSGSAVGDWVGSGSGVKGVGVYPTGGTKIGGVCWYRLHPAREIVSSERMIFFTDITVVSD